MWTEADWQYYCKLPFTNEGIHRYAELNCSRTSVSTFISRYTTIIARSYVCLEFVSREENNYAIKYFSWNVKIAREVYDDYTDNF